MLLIPARAAGIGADDLPPDYQRILPIVREAAGRVKAKEVGGVLGLPFGARGKRHAASWSRRLKSSTSSPTAARAPYQGKALRLP